MNSSDRQFEEQRLGLVLEEIRRQISRRQASLDKEEKTNAEAVKLAWEEEIPVAAREFEDMVAMAAETERMTNYLQYRALSTGILRKLEKLRYSPYFGRIDFRESADKEAIRLYIGISSLVHEDSGEHLVIDWRAPVSSMFYDYELGPAQYKSQIGTVYGELLLKRQFRIENSVLKLMFDSSLKIDDEILQEVLGKASGDRMRTIVNTIQKEQNQIIRNEDRKVLVVQGVAGSGKTSIALHRAAYLLYRHRNTVKSENIVIFSPNQVFADYISAVLPELGEENVAQTTFRDFARAFLGHDLVFEDVHAQQEYLIANRGPALPTEVRDKTDSASHTKEDYDTRLAGIRWKSSAPFIQTMKDYAAYLAKSVKLEPVVFRDTVVASRKELQDLLNLDYSYMPLHRRLDKVRRRVLWLLRPLEQNRRKEVAKDLAENPEREFYFESEIPSVARVQTAAEFRTIKEKLEAWTLRDTFDEYLRLWKDDGVFHAIFDGKELPSAYEEIRKQTVERLSSNFVSYEDLAPLLLLRGLLEGMLDGPPEMEPDGEQVRRAPSFSQARHVILDEAQDYSAVQYQVLKEAFPEASLTILGDLNQSVHPGFAISGYDVIGKVFEDKNSALITLNKSYRSTRDIALFAKALLPEGESLEALERSGPLPRLFVTSASPISESMPLSGSGYTYSHGQDRLLSQIARDLESLSREGFKSIAIICKTATESQLVYERLSQLREQAQSGPISSNEGPPSHDRQSHGQRTGDGELTAGDALNADGTLNADSLHPSDAGHSQDALPKIHLVRAKDRRFVRGIVVIPSYLAKGLEFETALIYGADAWHYSHPDDRRLLHMVCTRALHKLYLYSDGPVSPFISEVDPALYESCT